MTGDTPRPGTSRIRRSVVPVAVVAAEPAPVAPVPAAPPPVADALVGERLGNYRLEEFLGAGGMGRVYRATQLSLERQVAIKILNPEWDSEEYLQRFAREARSAAAVNSPVVMRIYDFGMVHDRPFLASELIQGQSLGTLVRAGKQWTDLALVQVLLQVLDGLMAIAKAGMVHRDLTLDNVLVSEAGAVKIIDFGLAKPPVGGDLTLVGSLPGTPQFMALEQFLNQPLDHRTDQFSLGVVAFHMLTGGVRPFPGTTPLEIFDAQRRNQIVHPACVRAGLNLALVEVVLRMLARDREQRFPTHEACADALRAALRSTAPRSRWARSMAGLIRRDAAFTGSPPHGVAVDPSPSTTAHPVLNLTPAPAAPAEPAAPGPGAPERPRRSASSRRAKHDSSRISGTPPVAQTTGKAWVSRLWRIISSDSADR